MDIGFVIMPFGKGFDDLYEKIYAPVIKAAGLMPLRADEIYDNQPIIQDISHSIHSAKVILADVTGRNPNVNYELGAAHALGKEVIIVTENSDDVPSDYRHIRYIRYNRHDIDWNRDLSEALEKTLQTVLERLGKPQYEEPCFVPWDVESEEQDEYSNVTERAKAEGFKDSYYDADNDMLIYSDFCVRLEDREGQCGTWWAAVAFLLNEKVRKLSHQLAKGHYIRMRWLFIDNYASHAFGVDYIYKTGSLPLFTEYELTSYLNDEFCGQILEAQIRYIEESADFDLNDNKYYSLNSCIQEQEPVSWRNGYYVADIDSVFSNAGHSFYRLRGLLPLSSIHASGYALNESHWLADWNQTNPEYAAGDTVCFKLEKAYEPAERGHVSNARNINFSSLKKLRQTELSENFR